MAIPRSLQPTAFCTAMRKAVALKPIPVPNRAAAVTAQARLCARGTSWSASPPASMAAIPASTELRNPKRRMTRPETVDATDQATANGMTVSPAVLAVPPSTP
ncbi:hypothetical protein HRbin27_01498 [bacterium HR27]|nr:hypothetical protein HRbin27_01498 [bacterium HR27]